MNTKIKSGALAVLIAAGTAFAGVSQVANAQDDQAMVDLKTERAIHRALLGDADLASSQIFVSCENGIVTLHGSAQNDGAKARAASIVKGIEGVTEVRNNIIGG